MSSDPGKPESGSVISLAERRPMKHACILHASLKAGNGGGFEFEPGVERSTVAKLTRHMLSEDELAALPSCPKVLLRANFREKRIPEVFGFLRGTIFFTPAMRAYLEELEPGVHSFFPIDLHSTMKIDGRTEHGEHYLLLHPPVVDCLVISETDFWKGYGIEGWIQGEDGQGGGGLSPPENQKCTLRREDVAGRHLWLTKVGSSYTEYTCSDRFWDGVRDKLMIWSPHTRCNLK